MSRFSKLTEMQIAKALKEGQFDGLKGEGQPLPKREGEAFLDAGLSVGLRAMAQAGVVPEEIELKKKLELILAKASQANTDEEKKLLFQEAAKLNLKYEIAKEARRKFFK